ncbi:AbrB family transcriptional regulator [Vogesella sp. GCM10023246]|uniref:AbrB family transcriptional regulator n=1 Tax=Vogesella oryzagri TaxID=3160864 RepID=A0ABV1M1A0_9NEIS
MLYFSYASTLLISLAGVFFWQLAGGPLPWLIGPLLAVMAGKLLHAELNSIRHSRELGQAIVGVALGLTFSPQALHRTLQLAPWILLAVAFALGLAWLSMRLMRRLLPTLDPLTAWLVALPGGAYAVNLAAVDGYSSGSRISATNTLHTSAPTLNTV